MHSPLIAVHGYAVMEVSRQTTGVVNRIRLGSWDLYIQRADGSRTAGAHMESLGT